MNDYIHEPHCAPKYGATNPAPSTVVTMPIKRFGSVIGLHHEKERYYRELHSDAWPEVIERLKRSNIRNYSVYISEIAGRKYLFSYFEYVGRDIEADMRAIADDPVPQRWWKETDPCQIQLPTRKPGAHWSDMEMVFLME
jgi:L-rhamnose mutarotase